MDKMKMTIEQHFARYNKIMDAYLEKGGLDPKVHRSPWLKDSPRWIYEFNYDFLGKFISFASQREESGVKWVNIFAGVEIVYVDTCSKFEFWKHLKEIHEIPSEFEIYMGNSREMILAFVMPLDTLSDIEIFELLMTLQVKSKRLYRDFKESKTMTLIEIEDDVSPKYPT